MVAGPTCGRSLAELGAEVIKVEPVGGDPYRNTGTVVPNEGKRFQSLNLGKRSIVVDLKHPAGRELIHRLVQTVDIVVINYRHGVARRLGIDYETLSGLNPALIYCRLTGFGVHNSRAETAATDPMMQAYAGLMVGGGKIGADGLPVTIGAAAIADAVTGYVAALGACAALYARRESGRGQLVDASLLRSALAVQETNVMREPIFDATQRDPMVAELDRIRRESGSYAEMLEVRDQAHTRTMSLRFYAGTYPARDGVIMLGALTPKSRQSRPGGARRPGRPDARRARGPHCSRLPGPPHPAPAAGRPDDRRQDGGRVGRDPGSGRLPGGARQLPRGDVRRPGRPGGGHHAGGRERGDGPAAGGRPGR